MIINTLILIESVVLLFSYYFSDALWFIRIPDYILCNEIILSIIGIILSILIMRKNCRYRIAKAAIVIALQIINILIIWITV